jgi:hypothetical protein
MNARARAHATACCSVLLFSAVAWGSVDTGELAVDAATGDLQCPREQLTATQTSTSQAYKSDIVHDEYDVVGCHQLARYDCQYLQAPFSRENGSCALLGVTSASSTLTVDGRPFVPDGDNLCRSGAKDEFIGVELQSDTGDAMRIIQTPAFALEIVVVLADGFQLPTFDACTVGNVEQDPATGMSGEATVSCTAGTSNVQGNITFKNCP